MKIVIDIAEALLNENMISVDVFPAKGTISDVNIFGRYADFVILPKGHGDLIDRNALLNGEHFIIKGNATVGDKDFGVQEIDVFSRSAIENAPIIIEADKGEHV